MSGPCKTKNEQGVLVDCPIRHIGCHAHCDKYVEYRNERDAINKKRCFEGEISATFRARKDRVYKKLRKLHTTHKKF